MNSSRKDRRRIKLIKPRLQLKLIGIFVGLSALGFLMQSLHVGLRLSELAANVPEGGPYLMAVMPELPLEILAVSFGMLLPLIIAVGILITFRVAGPIYKFEEYLKRVIIDDWSAIWPFLKTDGSTKHDLTVRFDPDGDGEFEITRSKRVTLPAA